MIAGLTSLAYGLASIFEGGRVIHTVVVMDRGLLIVRAISHGASLVALADVHCDIGHVAYEMALLGEQAGHALSPPAAADQPTRGPEGGRFRVPCGPRSIAGHILPLPGVVESDPQDGGRHQGGRRWPHTFPPGAAAGLVVKMVYYFTRRRVGKVITPVTVFSARMPASSRRSTQSCPGWTRSSSFRNS